MKIGTFLTSHGESLKKFSDYEIFLVIFFLLLITVRDSY